MMEKVYYLKKMILDLEINYKTINIEELNEKLDNIIDICKDMKKGMVGMNDSYVDPLESKIINTIPFLYKPLTKKNYFEGDYIIKFAEERTEELKEAGALEVHNEFWTEHKPIKGNVFGSIPKELLNEKSLKKILLSGWEDVDVNVIEILEKNITPKRIIDYCEKVYGHYILIKEETTKTYLVLNYKID